MDTFVTCIYNGLYHTEFGGRNMRNSRYRESLMNIANTGVKIFCYTSSKEYVSLKTDFAQCSNIEIIIKELESMDISPLIQNIKRTNKEKYSDLFWTQRCVEIMWGKFFMIQEILNRNEYENVYWIDAGLFHNDVISPKYFLENKPALVKAGVALFNPYLMDKLHNYLHDKLILAQHINPHNRPIETKYNSKPYKNGYGAVGGFFGGNAGNMKIICNSFIEKMYVILANNELCSEESILAGVYADHEELFKPFTFQSWYHEGWADRYDPSLISFSNMFDFILERDKLQNDVVFCTLSAGERFRNYTKDLLIKTFLTQVEESIKLVVFTDNVEDFPDYGPRIIFKKIDNVFTNYYFHYGLKYKVIQETHRLFDDKDKIFYLDADCFFEGAIKSSDFDEAIPGLNIALGNYSSAVVNPQIITKYKAITNLATQLKPSKEINPTKQFRECAMIFKIEDKHTFNKFLGEWECLYEFCISNNLTFSGEYVEITYAAFLSDYPIVNTSGNGFFKMLRNNVHTIILNNKTQAIF